MPPADEYWLAGNSIMGGYGVPVYSPGEYPTVIEIDIETSPVSNPSEEEVNREIEARNRARIEELAESSRRNREIADRNRRIARTDSSIINAAINFTEAVEAVENRIAERSRQVRGRVISDYAPVADPLPRVPQNDARRDGVRLFQGHMIPVEIPGVGFTQGKVRIDEMGHPYLVMNDSAYITARIERIM